ncbi:hypothetical protein [Polyangium sp. y55x31]|uniref:hypothetical protein n=1 Tax=Polyangium sp. y55x31 TaxID=3042688 RepID=UPI002482B7DA|nr:hypothetical protein [Polyangium sp. y55x31]MDI1475953.1 hypothetical protein [Polyangium sp. y55x31]
MRPLPRLALAMAPLLVAACGFFYTDMEDWACPPEGTQLTYENFGAAFMNAHCQSCHASTATDRAGAPGEFIFDTKSQIQRHRARIFARSAAENDSMPPGPDDPTLDDRMKLADWLACGAP